MIFLFELPKHNNNILDFETNSRTNPFNSSFSNEKPEIICTIIIPTFNRNDLLYTCLDSILPLAKRNIEIIVVNDNPKNKIELPFNLKYNAVEIVDNPKQGVASARNFGAYKAKGEFLIFIDDDMIVDPLSISSCIEFLQSSEKSVYNSDWVYSDETNKSLELSSFGRFLKHINFNTLKGWNDNPKDWEKTKFYKNNGITSQFLGMKKIDFEKAGGYNEIFPFAGFEDYDFWQRLKKQDISVYIDTDIKIIHNELDKLTPKQWYARKYRGGITQKVAVIQGYKELVRQDNLYKKIIFKYFYYFQSLIFYFFNLKNKKIDTLSFMLFKILIGANLSKGYYKK
jgi:GT2 family glycosyltransferase